MNLFYAFIIRFQSAILLLVAFSLFWMNFADHRISFLSTERFIENEYGSERFVIHRLIYNQNHPAGDYGGLMIAFEGDDNIQVLDRQSPAAFVEKVKEINAKIKAGEKPQIYPSHAAFQLDILQPFWSTMNKLKENIVQHAKPDSRVAKRLHNDWEFYLYQISTGFAAALSALVLAFFILWVRREFSLATAYVALAGLLILCPPLTYFGRNLWWMMGIWFIPMVAVFWGYALSKNQTPRIWQLFIIGGLAGLGIFARVSCGYEYASTIMMSALIPVIYYNVKNKVPRFDFILSILIIGGLVFCGFVAALYHHYLVLEHAGIDAIATIHERFMMRASGSGDGGGEIAESVRASVWGVIAKYLFKPQKIAPPEILYVFPVLLYWRKWGDALSLPLIWAIGAGFVGAISMFVILKGHAYIHGFDTVAWYIPLNILIILWGAVQLTKTQVSKAHPQ